MADPDVETGAHRSDLLDSELSGAGLADEECAEALHQLRRLLDPDDPPTSLHIVLRRDRATQNCYIATSDLHLSDRADHLSLLAEHLTGTAELLDSTHKETATRALAVANKLDGSDGDHHPEAPR